MSIPVTIEEVKKLTAYQQLKAYAEHQGYTPAQLGALVKKFKANCERQWSEDGKEPNPGYLYSYKRGVGFAGGTSVDCCFHWEKTPEGHDFWREVDWF